jgi:hypothetical protein
MDKYRTYKDIYNISKEVLFEIQASSYGTLITHPVAQLKTLHLIPHEVFQLNGKHFKFSIRTSNTALFAKNVCTCLIGWVAQIIAYSA